MPGFVTDIFRIACFRGHILFMDVALRLERKFYHEFHHCNSRIRRGDDLRNGKQFMRNGQCPYTKCIG